MVGLQCVLLPVQFLKGNYLESTIKALNLQYKSDSCFHLQNKTSILFINLIILSFLKPVFIVSGEKESGKTTFLINILSLLQTNGFVVGGFVALHEKDADCYQIKDIKTNKVASLMQRVASFEKRPYHFKFFSQGVEMGNNCIEELLVHPPDIVIVDEIGGYELRGKLWSSSFTQLVESSVPMIFSVKESLLDKVMAKWSISPSHLFSSADFNNPGKAFECIKRFL